MSYKYMNAYASISGKTSKETFVDASLLLIFGSLEASDKIAACCAISARFWASSVLLRANTILPLVGNTRRFSHYYRR